MAVFMQAAFRSAIGYLTSFACTQADTHGHVTSKCQMIHVKYDICLFQHHWNLDYNVLLADGRAFDSPIGVRYTNFSLSGEYTGFVEVFYQDERDRLFERAE